jgi:YfiH family protein
MEPIIPDWPAPLNVGALSTTRRGGASNAPYDDGAGGGGLNLGAHVGDCPQHVAQNRALVADLLPSAPVWLTQVHGTQVIDAADVPPGAQTEADASVSNVPGVVCAVQTADCLPVLLCDVHGRVVGAAHAGWRGLAAGVLENTVAAMRARGATDMLAWMGPAIGPARFEVGEEVRAAFLDHDAAAAGAFVARPRHAGKYLADMYLLARQRLARAGVTSCHGGGFCTVSDAGRFYSYRRDRVTGRMASLIWIK